MNEFHILLNTKIRIECILYDSIYMMFKNGKLYDRSHNSGYFGGIDGKASISSMALIEKR